jgi:hypothetical protein
VLTFGEPLVPATGSPAASTAIPRTSRWDYGSPYATGPGAGRWASLDGGVTWTYRPSDPVTTWSPDPADAFGTSTWSGTLPGIAGTPYLGLGVPGTRAIPGASGAPAYSSPTTAGLDAIASPDAYWDAAIRYAGEFAGFRLETSLGSHGTPVGGADPYAAPAPIATSDTGIFDVPVSSGDLGTTAMRVGESGACPRWTCAGGMCSVLAEPCPSCPTTSSGSLAPETPLWLSAQPLAVGAFQVGVPPVAEVARQPALQRIAAPGRHDPAHLFPVTVAVIDSGIDLDHPRLAPGNIWWNPHPFADAEYPGAVVGWNFVHRSPHPIDDYGHGTFVAGLVAAVNPAARIMSLKVIDSIGGAVHADVTRAVLFAVHHGARVINLSLGDKGASPMLQVAIDFARSRGVVVVVAAGNNGVDTGTWLPANLKGALVVGATDLADRKPRFGNWGQHVSLAAPGTDVVSWRARRTDFVLVATAGKSYKPEENFVGADRQLYRASGTSFSAPLVAGAASLLFARNPNLTGGQVERMLVESADDVETPGWDQYTGAGRLNVTRALAADPNYYLRARITTLVPARESSGTVVRVNGTAAGQTLASYQVQLGQGESPTGWKTVAVQRGTVVEDAVLASFSAREITARGKWTVRVIVQDTAGRTREARGSLDVQ